MNHDRNWAWWIATVGGIGRVPRIPGTVGSLAGLALVWSLQRAAGDWGVTVAAAAVVPVTLLAVAASSALAAGRRERDPQIIVIDEVCGMLVAVAGLSLTATTAGLGFLFFRLFDIVKPFPISWIERRAPGGWGIVGDDLAAGVAANLCTRAVLAWFGGWGA
jgi:phosphatidylglycerophosphatase A